MRAQHSTQRQVSGFTLIELMIVVLVAAILAAVAYPSFIEQVRKSRRTDAASALVDLAAKLERYYAGNGSYTGTSVNALLGRTTSEEGYYNLTMNVPLGGQSYALTATRAGDQINDKCGNFTLNSLGDKGVSGSIPANQCW